MNKLLIFLVLSTFSSNSFSASKESKEQLATLRTIGGDRELVAAFGRNEISSKTALLVKTIDLTTIATQKYQGKYYPDAPWIHMYDQDFPQLPKISAFSRCLKMCTNLESLNIEELYYSIDQQNSLDESSTDYDLIKNTKNTLNLILKLKNLTFLNTHKSFMDFSEESVFLDKFCEILKTLTKLDHVSFSIFEDYSEDNYNKLKNSIFNSNIHTVEIYSNLATDFFSSSWKKIHDFEVQLITNRLCVRQLNLNIHKSPILEL